MKTEVPELERAPSSPFRPQSATEYFQRARSEGDRRELMAAIADYTRAIQLKPDSADAYCNRGCALENEGDLDGAISDYTRSIQLNPKLGVAYSNRDGLLTAAGVGCAGKTGTTTGQSPTKTEPSSSIPAVQTHTATAAARAGATATSTGLSRMKRAPVSLTRTIKDRTVQAGF